MRATFLLLATALLLTGCADSSGPDLSQIANVIWVDGEVYGPVHNVENLGPGAKFGEVAHVMECGDEEHYYEDDPEFQPPRCGNPDNMPGIWSNSLPVGTPVHAAADRSTDRFLMALHNGTRILLVREGEMASVEGEVVARDGDTVVGAGLPNIHVRESDTDACGVVFAIDPDTGLEKAEGSGFVPATVEDLAVGRRVRAWSPNIAESCPAQAIAYYVRILE